MFNIEKLCVRCVRENKTTGIEYFGSRFHCPQDPKGILPAVNTCRCLACGDSPPRRCKLSARFSRLPRRLFGLRTAVFFAARRIQQRLYDSIFFACIRSVHVQRAAQPRIFLGAQHAAGGTASRPLCRHIESSQSLRIDIAQQTERAAATRTHQIGFVLPPCFQHEEPVLNCMPTYIQIQVAPLDVTGVGRHLAHLLFGRRGLSRTYLRGC